MSQTVRFQDNLRRLAMMDERFVLEDVGVGLDPEGLSALDPKTAALLQVGVSVAIGSSAVSLGWSVGCRSRSHGDEILTSWWSSLGRARSGRRRRPRCSALGYDVEDALRNDLS
jgi:hypothetical protein